MAPRHRRHGAAAARLKRGGDIGIARKEDIIIVIRRFDLIDHELHVIVPIGEIVFQLFLPSRGRPGFDLPVAALDDPTPCAIKDVELSLEAGERRQYVVVEIPDALSWSPAAPALYRPSSPPLIPGRPPP